MSAGFSTLCTRHRHIKARHGHPEQMGVTVHELRPYVRKVAARNKANPTSPAWTILTDRWARTAEQAQQTIAAYEAGQVSVRHAVQAAHQVKTLAGSVPALAVVHAYAAMYLLADAEPRRFRSDRAFDFQLARRVRGLTSANAGTYYDHKTGKMKRTYRDMPPRAVEVFAQHLKVAFGSAGLQLARLEGQQSDAEAAERKRLADAIEALR